MREIGSETFEVVPLRDGTLPSASPAEVVAFLQEVAESQRVMGAVGAVLDETEEKLEAIDKAIARSLTAEFDAEVDEMHRRLYELRDRLSGDQQKTRVSELQAHNVGTWMNVASFGNMMSTYGPTPTHQRSLEIAQELLEALRADVAQLADSDLPELEERLEAAGVAWTKGRKVPQ